MNLCDFFVWIIPPFTYILHLDTSCLFVSLPSCVSTLIMTWWPPGPHFAAKTTLSEWDRLLKMIAGRTNAPTYCFPQTIPEPCLLGSRVHYPASAGYDSFTCYGPLLGTFHRSFRFGNALIQSSKQHSLTVVEPTSPVTGHYVTPDWCVAWLLLPFYILPPFILFCKFDLDIFLPFSCLLSA